MDARATRCLDEVYLGSPETLELTRPVAPILKGAYVLRDLPVFEGADTHYAKSSLSNFPVWKRSRTELPLARKSRAYTAMTASQLVLVPTSSTC